MVNKLYPPFIGGMEGYIRALAEALQRLPGVRVDVVVGQRWLGLGYQPLLRRFLERAARIVVWSHELLESSAELRPFRHKTVVLPGAIEVSRFVATPESRVHAASLRARISGGRPIVLFVGRLVYYKGLAELIAAMRDVDAVLLIVGDGPLRRESEALADRLGLRCRVHFRGEVDAAELPAVYQASDLLVLPSTHRTETFGLVQLEAHVAGIPSICTALGTGVESANVHGVTGLVVPPRDHDALREAIISLLGDDERRWRMGRCAQERALRDFDIASHARRMRAVYDDVLRAG